LNSGHWFFQLNSNSKTQHNSHAKFAPWKKKKNSKGVSKQLLKEMDSSTHSLTMIRHPKEGRFNSHRVNPRFPLSAPMGGGPHTDQNVFWVQH
jgi:hypothetical protein